MSSVIALLLVVTAVTTSLWRKAVLEVARREAAQILALGRLEIENRPTAAVAVGESVGDALAVDKVQRLRHARLFVPFTGTGRFAARPAEQLQQLRRQLTIRQRPGPHAARRQGHRPSPEARREVFADAGRLAKRVQQLLRR